MSNAVVIGAGPAGLMAADVLSREGVSVTVYDAMPSVGRKFLMAGKSGLNMTKDDADYLDAYGDVDETFRAILSEFPPQEVIKWAEGLGQEVFVGSTGRVFPKVMKASPLLRAWMRRLNDQGCEVVTKTRWTGWNGEALTLAGPEGVFERTPDITVLALGGASWARLGSDGQWADHFPGDVASFLPTNMGLVVDWSPHMAKFFGTPVKGCRIMVGEHSGLGEFVISQRGVEGGGIYELSRYLRETDAFDLNLLPHLSLGEVRAKLAERGKASLSTFLKRSFRLDPVKIALLNEYARPFPADIAPLLKSLTIRHEGPRPIDEAISVAGGLKFAALDENLMLKQRPGVFCAGEMLDWEAPTGGYLITGCLATGQQAGLSALQYLRSSL